MALLRAEMFPDGLFSLRGDRTNDFAISRRVIIFLNVQSAAGLPKRTSKRVGTQRRNSTCPLTEQRVTTQSGVDEFHGPNKRAQRRALDITFFHI